MPFDLKKWAKTFSLLGSSERLSIMIVLHGAEYIRHTHGDFVVKEACLSFSQIGEASEIKSDTRLSYHLSKLIHAGLVSKRAAQDKKGRVFPMYTPTKYWRDFASELGIDRQIKAYIKKKYPESFVES